MNPARFTFVAIFLLTGFTVSAARSDTYPRQPGVDVLHYVFRVTVNDQTDEIAGETTVEVRFLQNNVTSLWLDLASTAGDKGMAVAGVSTAGAGARYEHKEDRLKIVLDPAPQAGEQRGFVISYRGVPRAGLRIGKNRHDDRTFFSENWPDKARHWLPTLDHPCDKATSEFLVTAPALSGRCQRFAARGTRLG